MHNAMWHGRNVYDRSGILVCEFVQCTNHQSGRYRTYRIRRTEVSDTKKASQPAREGIEQVREAGKAAVDSTVRSSKEALGRAEDVLNRTVDEAGAIGSSVADTMARSAEATVDLSQRVAEQGRGVMRFGMRTAGSVNSRFADTSYERNHRVLESTTRALEIYREAAESSAGKVQALFASWTSLGRGVQQMQLAYLQLLDRTLKGASHKPQDLLRAKSLEEFAAIQRDLYLDTLNYAFEASSTLLQMAAGVAQEARPAPQSRSLIVPAH
jgi:phasin protein